MINNHCPNPPARIFVSRENEIAITDFAKSILDQISEFVHDIGMDMTRIDSAISDSWMECEVCESRVHEVHENAMTRIEKQIFEIIAEEIGD